MTKTTSTTATEALLREVLDEDLDEDKERNLGLSYANLALGDFRFPVPYAERKRAAAGEPVFIPGDGTDASFGLRV